MKNFFIILFSVLSLNSSANQNEKFNEIIFKELSTNKNLDLTSVKIAEEDLLELQSLEYNDSTIDKKIDFWQNFILALAYSESSLNPKAISPKVKGMRAYGLLQINPQTAKTHCGVVTHTDLMDPEINLICGLKLMNWQLKGAPLKNGKLMRADLQGRLFGKNILLWGPLRSGDKLGRQRLYRFFFSAGNRNRNNSDKNEKSSQNLN